MSKWLEGLLSAEAFFKKARLTNPDRDIGRILDEMKERYHDMFFYVADYLDPSLDDQEYAEGWGAYCSYLPHLLQSSLL